MEDKKYDIVVVGYSMLGNIAALLFAHLGMSVAVLEKREPAAVLLAKSARIDEEILLIFEHLGLIDLLSPHFYPLKGTQLIDKKQRILLEFNQISKSQFAPIVEFYQPQIHLLLQQEAAKSPNITIFSTSELEVFEQNKTGVDVYFSKTGKQDFIKLKTDYLVVCNGQYSQIANHLKIGVEDYNFRSSVLCVDTIYNSTELQDPYAQTVYDAAFPVTKITNNKNRQRWEFQIPESIINERNTGEKVQDLLAELSHLDLKVDTAYVYNFESRILEKWQDKRVFITGDAAHIMPPYLGMGLSAGIKDLYNLAWKLKLVQEKVLTDSLLDSYTLERIPNVRYLLKLNLWIKELFLSSKLRWIKNLVPVIPKWFLRRTLNTSNQIKVGLIGSFLKGAGRPIISPFVVDNKGKIRSLNSLLGSNFILLSLGTNPVDALLPNQLEYMAKLKTQFIHLTPAQKPFKEDYRYAQNLQDKEGKLEKWLQQYHSKFVLIRPDRIVYEFCTNSQQLNKTILKMKEQLTLFVEEEEV